MLQLKKYLTRENIIISLILIAVFIFGFTATYFTLKFSKVFVKKTAPTPTPVHQNNINFAPAPDIPQEKGVYNTVLLGYGGAGHAGSLLTDSIIIVHVNTNSKTAALVSIPRDLWVPGNHKINTEASVNGIQNVGSVVKNVTGLPISYYVSVDFDRFIKIIDSLGGITVSVPETFSDNFYPVKGLENETCGFTADEINAFKAKYSGFELEKNFTCRYERIHYDQGQAELDGVAALKFVRSRHGDSDFGRSARQFAVLKGISKKSLSEKTIDSLSGLIQTDLNLSTIKSLIEVFGDPNAYSLKEVQLTTGNVLREAKSGDGQYILVPKAGSFNFSEIKNYISSQIK